MGKREVGGGQHRPRTDLRREETVSQTWSARILVFGSITGPPRNSSSTAMSLGSRGGDRKRRSIVNLRQYSTNSWADASLTSVSTTPKWYVWLPEFQTWQEVFLSRPVAVTQATLSHANSVFFSSCSVGFIKAFFTQFKVFSKHNYSQTVDNYAWWGSDPEHPQGIAILHNVAWPGIWRKILWLMVSKAATVGSFHVKTMQVAQLVWLSKSQGLNPVRDIQGHFSLLKLSCSYKANWLKVEYLQKCLRKKEHEQKTLGWDRVYMINSFAIGCATGSNFSYLSWLVWVRWPEWLALMVH